MDTWFAVGGKMFAFTLLRYFVLAGIPFIIVYVAFFHRFGRSKIQGRNATKKDFFREILHSSTSSIVLSGIAAILFFTPARSYTQLYTDLSQYPIWWVPVSIVLSLVIHDTYFYWMHRLLHHKRIFRFTHLLHHRSVNPSPWSAYSFHVFEAVAEGAIIIILALVMPLHPFSVIAFSVISLMINVYGHLGFEIMPRSLRNSFLFNIINTSVYHNLHHSKFRGNYGLYFRWWDKLMGTENPDYTREYDRIQQQRFGE